MNIIILVYMPTASQDGGGGSRRQLRVAVHRRRHGHLLRRQLLRPLHNRPKPLQQLLDLPQRERARAPNSTSPNHTQLPPNIAVAPPHLAAARGAAVGRLRPQQGLLQEDPRRRRLPPPAAHARPANRAAKHSKLHRRVHEMGHQQRLTSPPFHALLRLDQIRPRQRLRRQEPPRRIPARLRRDAAGGQSELDVRERSLHAEIQLHD